MKQYPGIVMALALCSSAVHAQSRDAALDAIIDAEHAFSKHSLGQSTQSAFVKYMAEDGYLYRPRVVRAQTYLNARPMPATVMLAWEPEYVDVSRAGDLGYTTGQWISSRRDMPQSATTFGQYVTIWRKQADGMWKAEINAAIAHGADPIGPQRVTRAPAPGYRGSGSSRTHRSSLLAADSAFALAAAAQDAEAAFRSHAGPSQRLLRMGRFPLTGDTARAVLRATPTYTWKQVGAGVSSSGDLGYTFGVYAIPNPLRRTQETGDYLRIWRRDASGAWKVVLDLTSPA